MTKDEKKKMLTLDYKLDPVEDFYVREDDEWGAKIIVRRTGIDKIERQIGMDFAIESLQVVPYGDKVCVTILGRAVADSMVTRSLVMTNPDNCTYPNYAEIAEKRCRHRCLLKLARLYEHNIFSQLESDKWMETRNEWNGAVSEVVKMININNATKIKKEQGTGAPGVRNGSKTIQRKA